MEARTDLSLFNERISQIRKRISSVIVGQQEAVDMLITCILANGHVLIEGMPGVAKTLMARLTAKLIDAKFSRIQFTPDLMPSDVLGTSVFSMKTSEFDFHPGPVFANIVLADEINRSPAKTQAALFEVMEERQATIDGNTYKMDDVYTIIATQNPIEQEGTYRLPEAQLDRFLMKITMGFPSVDEEVEILKRHNGNSQFARRDNKPDTQEQGGVCGCVTTCHGGGDAVCQGLCPAAGPRLRDTRRHQGGGTIRHTPSHYPQCRGGDERTDSRQGDEDSHRQSGGAEITHTHGIATKITH